LATCSLTELMIVASTHSAAAVPRIQRIICKCASACPESSSVRALGKLNVQQKPKQNLVQRGFSSGNFSSVRAERVLTGAQEMHPGD
jgi:hypothetical protein